MATKGGASPQLDKALGTLLSRNPEAGALALVGTGLVEMAQGDAQLWRKMYEDSEARCKKLREEIGFLRPLADRYLVIRDLIAGPLPGEGGAA